MLRTESQLNASVLVTGGGGFLGKAIIRRLLEKGYADITSFSRNFYPDLEKAGVKQIPGDLSDPEAADRACRGIEMVFHTAAKAGVWGKFEDYYQTNVRGTENILDACRRHKVGRLIYTSSASVVYNGRDMTGPDETVPFPETYLTHYPRTKAIAEKMVGDAATPDLRTIILRPHLIWGPGDNHLAPRIIARAASLAIVGSGKNVADTIYIDNAAEAHILAGEKLAGNPELSGNRYFISQDDRVPVWEMINGILCAAGLEPVRRKIPAGLAWLAGAVLEWIYRSFNIQSEPGMTRFVARELSTSHWYDISAAKRDLGFRPWISTEEGLDRLEKWFIQTGIKGA